ncbi:MAG: hypothetical protein M3347_11190 [Armatimonadota bacterium]|nr:hypothetical protein [Armatimonadota bacterium]
MQTNWKDRARLFLYAALALSLCLGSSCDAKPYTPKAGSAERKAILDALRKPVEKEAKQHVIFYDVSLRVEKGWAFVTAISKDQTGRKLVLGDLATSGLLRKKGARWQVLHWGVAGDISVTCEAAKKYPKAPRSIFGATLSAC